MTSKTFVSGTVVDSAWLNDVNNAAYNGIIGAQTISYVDTGILGTYANTIAGYAQVIIQNKSNSSAASTNINVSNDIGTATTNFVEMGINSSSFTGTGSFSQPNNAYVASGSTDLVIGTYSNKAIRFVANNSTTDAGYVDTTGFNFPSVNGGQLAGMRNRIINGGMQIAQRGTITPGLGSTTTYTLDRWASYQTGAATAISQAVGNGTDQIAALSFLGVVSNTEVSLLQPIESTNCYDLAQTGFTLSVWVYASVTKNVDLILATPTTTRDIFSATTNLPSGSTTVSHPGTGWVKYTLTYSSVNALANATAIQRGLRVQIRFASCTSGTFGITGVQLEIGSVATPFEQRPYGMELALCQRYYQSAGTGSGVFGVANIYTSFQFPVTMRATPTVTVLPSGGSVSGTTISPSGFYAQCTAVAATGWTAAAEL